MNKKLQKKYFILCLFIVILFVAGWPIVFKGNIKDQNVQEVTFTAKAEQNIEPAALPNINVKSTLNLPILMYHHVGFTPTQANSTRIDMTTSPADFENQVKWIYEHGYNSISFKDLYEYSKGKYKLPNNPIIFTFDDGYTDVFENALPILKKYGFLGSVGVITNFTGQTQGDNSYASWQAIAAAFDEGNEITSHTQNHFNAKNPGLDSRYIFSNLSGSVSDISQHLGITTKTLVYPFGSYSPEYIEQAKLAGFTLGVTVREGKNINLDNLMEIPRIRIHGKTTMEKFTKLLTD